jgi:voltage-gated potassium channel
MGDARRAEPHDHLHIAGLEPEEVLEAFLTFLALAFAAIVVVEFTADLTPAQSRWLELSGLVIWLIFTVDFVVRLALAGSKAAYLRSNWLSALAVLLPAFRVARIFRAIRVLRLLRLGRVVTTAGRSVRAAQEVVPGGIGYVALLSGLLILLGAAGMYTLERDASGSGIDSFGDALWWAAGTLTTIGSGIDPVTLEGRVLAVLMMVFGLGIGGFITATVAVFLLGRKEERDAGLREDMAELRAEIASLRESVDAARESGSR